MAVYNAGTFPDRQNLSTDGINKALPFVDKNGSLRLTDKFGYYFDLNRSHLTLKNMVYLFIYMIYSITVVYLLFITFCNFKCFVVILLKIYYAVILKSKKFFDAYNVILSSVKSGLYPISLIPPSGT